MLEGRCHCGGVGWTYSGTPDAATLCNCTLCRSYGVLWIYGRLGAEISLAGETKGYVRPDGDGDLAVHFCTTCGAVQSWQPAQPETTKGYRMAVNIRLADPAEVAALPIRRFDGFSSWQTLADDGRRVADLLT